MTSGSTSERPLDGVLLDLLRARVADAAPKLGDDATIHDEVLLGPGGWGVVMLPSTHSDSPTHFDIGFVDHVAEPDHSMVIDCISGEPEHVAHIWRETSGACLLEMLTNQGEFAEHYRGEDERGLPGWHVVESGVLAYSIGGTEAQRRPFSQFMWDSNVLRQLSDVILPTLDRPKHNGIKVFYHKSPPDADGEWFIRAEVRVNGVVDLTASGALMELDWPEAQVPTFVRFYAVALRPEL